MEKNADTSVLARLNLIRNQLNGINYKSKYNPLDKFKTNSKFEKNSFIKTYFPFDNHYEFRQKIFNIIKNNPEFRTNPYQTEMSSSQMKDLLHRQMKILVREVDKFLPFKELRNDPIKFGMFMEAINHMDIGLSVRFAFHSILYYNSLVFLGTEKHKIFIEKSLSLEDVGCFGLTELGHGSNVRSVKTTAHYDEKLKEFVLNTPSQEAYKWWIGGAGRTSNMAIIFAQLYTKGSCYGVHAFLVPIRDKGDHMPFPGVVLGDTGPKVGNDSIDNGFIAFNNYRVHKDALLDKFSSVDDDGQFSSSISNPDTRFATALGALSEGRVGVGIGSQCLLINAVTIAGRYACLRPQFSTDLSGQGEESPIIDYPTTQVRILPALAESFAIRAACFDLGMRWIKILPYVTETKNPNVIQTHSIISGLKAYSSWTIQSRLQQLREVMGGHGYSRFNMIGALRNNNDINTTWEGDNTVLQQQTAKFILDNFQKRMKGKDPSKEYSTLKFMNRLDDDSKPEFKSSKDLEKVENLRTCFQQRIIVLLLKSVEKLANQVQEKKDSLLVAWNNSQVFYIQPMVKAFIENYVFECFLDIIEKIQEDSTRKMMMSFLRLYSFTVFDSEWSLLRNDDFIDSDAVFLIKEEILNLCKMLKSELIPILDIIAPDDEILQAPMGRSDGRIWESYFSKVFSFNRCFERLDWWENLHFK